MKIRGKLISSFGAVTVTILLVYAALVYVSFSESIRQDRTETYNSQVKAAVLATEMQIWQQMRALSQGNASGPSGLDKEQLFSGLRVLTFDDTDSFSWVALEKETKMQLPAVWRSFDMDRYLALGPQLLSEGNRTVLLQFETKGKGLVCSLFEVNRPQLAVILRHSLLLEKSKLFLSRDMKPVMELADQAEPDETFLAASHFEDLKKLETFLHHQQGKFLPLGETIYLFSAKADFFGLHIDYLLPRSIFLKDLLRLKNRVIAATIILAWIAVWVILVIAYGFSKPIVKLAKVINDMIAFNYQTPLEFTPSGDELGELARSFETMRQKIEQLVTKDPLTKTYNRGFLMHMFKVSFARARRYNEKLACIILDIDHFKNINDTYGHQAGDDVLQAVGNLLLEGTRSSDLVSTVARYGGEEFVVLLPGLSADDAFQVAERLRQAVATQSMPHGIACTMSLGVAVLHQDHDTPDSLLHDADKALYRAKKRGRNRTELFDKAVSKNRAENSKNEQSSS